MIFRPCSRAEADQLRQPRHRPVLVHDLADHAGREEPGEPGEVDGGLGVTGALEHAALAVPQREDVARAWKVLRRGRAGSTIARIVVARSAADIPVRDPAAGVHRHGECRVALIGVVGDHQRDLELVESHRPRPACRSRRSCAAR